MIWVTWVTKVTRMTWVTWVTRVTWVIKMTWVTGVSTMTWVGRVTWVSRVIWVTRMTWGIRDTVNSWENYRSHREMSAFFMQAIRALLSFRTTNLDVVLFSFNLLWLVINYFKLQRK